MRSIAAILYGNESGFFRPTIESLDSCGIIKTKAVISAGAALSDDAAIIETSSLWSKQALLDCLEWFGGRGCDALLLVDGGAGAPVFDPRGLERMVRCMSDTGASIVYGDYSECTSAGTVRIHPLIDYQPGSIRDTFNFGPAMLINGRYIEAVREAISSTTTELTCGGLYDFRLRLTEHAPAMRLPESLYRCLLDENSGAGHGHFAYVDPRNRTCQLELERIATAHLQRIGAFIAAPARKPLVADGDFAVKASVVIPVKNRARTIGDAIHSALSQKTSFDFNVIVVDNHSGDGTSEIISRTAAGDRRLVHHVPGRGDLLIGGCWNEALYSAACGLYAVQLDSDDLYDGADVLERIVAAFDTEKYAMVIGSYTTVNFKLEPLPPGLVDHREWTAENGHNNALRIAGLGAPRAYHAPTLRRFGFPNVSYGEDYAVVLRLSRSFPIGRIYDSLYWCRRWEENSDSALPLETANRYDHCKDRLRTIEIAARKRGEECG